MTKNLVIVFLLLFTVVGVAQKPVPTLPTGITQASLELSPFTASVILASPPAQNPPRRPYWRAIASTSGVSDTITQPIIGTDTASGNSYYGNWAFWEPARLKQMHVWVLAGHVMQANASLGISSTHTTVQDTTDCGPVCALEAWPAQGFISYDPLSWQQCAGGTDAYNECGGQPLPAHVHMAASVGGSSN